MGFEDLPVALEMQSVSMTVSPLGKALLAEYLYCKSSSTAASSLPCRLCPSWLLVFSQAITFGFLQEVSTSITEHTGVRLSKTMRYKKIIAAEEEFSDLPFRHPAWDERKPSMHPDATL